MAAPGTLIISERPGKRAILAEIRSLEVSIGLPRSPRSFNKHKSTEDLLKLWRRRLYELAHFGCTC